MEDSHGNDFSGMKVKNFDVGVSLNNSNNNNFSDSSFTNDENFHKTIDTIEQEMKSKVPVDDFVKISKTIEQMRNNYKGKDFKKSYLRFIEVTAQHVSIVAPFLPLLAPYIPSS
ncbi:hypothetical protein BN136_3711 [Cronobacter universalis NCTC 9529]|nr:hypothetical protein BN136_3711 [Cronobacter universalis NCTC 9529]